MDIELELENIEWDIICPTGGIPPQPFRVIIPQEIAPIITPRLYLRQTQMEDAESFRDIKSSPEHVKWSYPYNPNPTIDETKSWIRSKIFTAPDLAAGRCYHFAIIQRDDPSERVIGAVGVNQVLPVPNVGYGVHLEFNGKGYATEALKGILDTWWAFPRVPAGEGTENEKGNKRRELVIAHYNKKNHGSAKVLEKCGFMVYNEHLYDDGSVVCFAALQRPESQTE
ncbi:hypothetical protein FQN57_004847 [Myotisia sp. PD_48]|nr:hypothetical protein FQN57_004847 [Myotisia sp. PD_48]